MFVVALTRWGQAGPPYRNPERASVESEVAALAPVLGAGAYELRLALAATPPVVLLETPEQPRAKELLALLRGRGHGAVACDAASVASSDEMSAPRSFELRDDALVLDSPFPYDQMLALIVATHLRQAETSEQHTSTKLSLGRAVLSGGMVLTKKSTVSHQTSSEEREPVLYVMHRSGAGHVILRANRLRYGGLGARIGRTVQENFQTTIALLRERAPGATFDDRLLKARKAGSALSVAGSPGQRTVVSSNEGDTDLAVHLLTVAALQGQL